MIPASVMVKLATLGLSPDHAEAVAAMLSAVEAATKIEAGASIEQRRSADRERKARQRHGKSRDIAGQDGTGRDTVSPKKETSPEPPKEKTTPSKSEAKASSGCDEKFAEFWLAYPRRDGPNPRKPAKLVFDRLVAKGADPERLIAAAQALAVEHPTPTRFVPHAKTWLNEERFGDVEPIISGDTFCAEDIPSTRLHVIRFRNGNDGADPPRAVQGGKAGYLIPTEWVKSMNMRQAHG